MDEHCRITVVGDHRQVDLAVPAGAPIFTFADSLARLCEQQSPDVMPAAWTLAPVTGDRYAPEWSLAELGITDGEVLYLRDLVADEMGEPVVYDVPEQVAEVAPGMMDHRWDPRARTFTIMGVALSWAAVTPFALALRHEAPMSLLGDLSLALGLFLPVLAWVALERGWPLPAPLRLALGLSAVPLLSLAAGCLAAANGAHGLSLDGLLTKTGFVVAAVATGALCGAYLAYAAAPTVASCALLLAALVATVLAFGLTLLQAGIVQVASAVAAVAFGLLTVMPTAASRTAGFAYRRVARREQTEPEPNEVLNAVRSATLLLVVGNAVLSLVLTLALVVMAASTSPYANAAAGLLAWSLLLRAGVAPLVAEVVPLLLAGTSALFTLLLVGPAHVGWGGWVAPTYTWLIGAVLLGYGFRRVLRHPNLPSMERPRWLTAFASVLAGGSVALVVTTFGAFGALVALGHKL